MIVDIGDAVAVELLLAIRSGDLPALRRLLTTPPGLAAAYIRRRKGLLTPLHITTDWPGYFPEAPEAVRVLLDAGADPDARTDGGPTPETPLHWAASSDDVDVAEVLLDAGAGIEAAGGTIGTPLDNAIGYGCWHVARLLTARGAKVDKLWTAAALGLTSSLHELLAADPAPEQVNEAFWQACHAGQRRIAEKLLRHGADIDSIPG